MEEEVECANSTVYLDGNSTEPNFFPHKYKTVAGSLIFFLLFPFVIFKFRFFPIRATVVVLVGATLMVFFDVVSQENVYAIVGLQNNLTTIFLLLGMMLLGEYIDREQMIVKIIRKLLPHDLSFSGFLFRACGIVFVLSFLFTSEGASMIFTPILLKCWKEHERARVELETLLIGIATSANIGGASSYFGSVMLAMIAAKTLQPPYQRSLLDLRMCLKHLLLPAVVCFWVNYALLVLHFQLRSRRLLACRKSFDRRRAEREPFGVGGRSGMNARQLPGNGFVKRDQNDEFFNDSYAFREDRLAHPPTLETIIEDEVLELPEPTWGSEFGSTPPYGSDGGGESFENESGNIDDTSGRSRLHSCLASEDLTSLDVEYSPEMIQSQLTSQNNSLPVNMTGNTNTCSRTIDRSNLHPAGSQCSFSGVSMVEFFGVRLKLFDQETSCGSSVLQGTLCVVIVAIIVLLIASGSYVYFDPGLISIAGAFLVILVDSLVNRFAAGFILRRIDWSLIAVFSALFIWMAGFNYTGVPRWVWHKLGFYRLSFNQVTSVAVFAAVIVLTANIFGQVPVTIIVLDQLEPCLDQRRLVLYLAWVVSIAGNLSPFSSASSAFVSSHSSHMLNHPVTLWSFVRYGIPTSFLLIAVGLVVISLLLMIG